jgi:Fructose-bisphosphate aldolase class-I
VQGVFQHSSDIFKLCIHLPELRFSSTRYTHFGTCISALPLQAWAGEPDNVKKAQDILYQLAVANGQAQVGHRHSFPFGMCALHRGCFAEQGARCWLQLPLGTRRFLWRLSCYAPDRAMPPLLCVH